MSREQRTFHPFSVALFESLFMRVPSASKAPECSRGANEMFCRILASRRVRHQHRDANLHRRPSDTTRLELRSLGTRYGRKDLASGVVVVIINPHVRASWRANDQAP